MKKKDKKWRKKAVKCFKNLVYFIVKKFCYIICFGGKVVHSKVPPESVFIKDMKLKEYS